MVEKVGGWDFCRLELDLDSALLMHFLYKDDEKQNTRKEEEIVRWLKDEQLGMFWKICARRALLSWHEEGGKSEMSEEKWFKFRRKCRQFERCIVKSSSMLIWQLYGRKTIFQHLTFTRKFEDWRLARIVSQTLISLRTTTTNYATWWKRIESCLTSLPCSRHVNSQFVTFREKKINVRESENASSGKTIKLAEGMSCRSSCRSKR